MKVQEQYKAQGLIVVGGHCQNVEKDKVVGLCRANKVNYTITNGGRVSGDTSSGIPHAFIFDASGKCVKEGHPEELWKFLEELIRTEPHWITRGKKLESAASKIADGLKAGKSFTWAWGECESLKKKGDDKAKEEAELLENEIKAEGERLLAEAGALESENAFKAQSNYELLAREWKKTEAGTKADEKLKALKKDKAFQEEVKVGQTVAQIEDLTAQLVPSGGKIDINYAPNRPIAQNIAGLAKRLKDKKHADSKCAQACLEELKKLGF